MHVASLLSRKKAVFCLAGLAIVLSAGIIVAAFSFGPRRALAEEQGMKLISVTGEAQLHVQPDMATVTLGVEASSQTAQQAVNLNSQKMQTVIDALLSMGIQRGDISTSNFSLHPEYELQNEKPYSGEKPAKQVLVGYRCQNMVAVKVRDITRVGPVIDAAVAAGATNVNGISFGLQDPDQYKDRLLAEAVRNARNKASVMADAAGVAIIGVYRMSDGWVSVEPVRAAEAMKVMYDYGVPIEGGTVTVRASVRVDFTF